MGNTVEVRVLSSAPIFCVPICLRTFFPQAALQARLCRFQGRQFSRRHGVDHAEILALQAFEKQRQHRHGLRSCVMEEQDAAPLPPEPAHHQLELRARCHCVPVARPEISPEYGPISAGEIIKQARRIGKAGKAEKRRDALPGRLNDGPFTGLDIGQSALMADVPHGPGMGHRMVRDGMAVRDHPADQMRARRCVPADQEEGCPAVLRFKQAQNPVGEAGNGAVIEGEDHFAVGQRQGLGIALLAELLAALMRHAQHARCAKPGLCRLWHQHGRTGQSEHPASRG